MMDDTNREEPIETGGGANLEGDISVGGDLVGRDKVVHGDEVGGDKVLGDKITAEKLIQYLEEKNIQGDYVEHQEIHNHIVMLGPELLDQLTAWLAEQQGVDKGTLRALGGKAAPEHINRQIEEVQSAQREATAHGVPVSPQASLRLGMLAAYRRDYESALDYFIEASQADPEFSEAFEATAWLQQSLAMDEIHRKDYAEATHRLAIARSAAAQTDPLDPQALALRGYIAKTLAQIAEAQSDLAGKEKFNQEAARLFDHVVKLDPENASAHNGLGNVRYALGDIPGAISAYERAISLVPNYTAAHHDLAAAFEDMWRIDPAQGSEWCQKALAAWRQTYILAPTDPAFSAEYVLKIGQRIHWLSQQCGP